MFMHSYIDANLWARGIRFLDRNSPQFPVLVKSAMTKVLGITDPDYMEEFFPTFAKMFMDRLTKKFENVKSKYRSNLTQLGKFQG